VRTSSAIVSTALALALAADAALAGVDATAAEFAQALQRKYDTVKDFSSDFVHSYRGGVLRKQIVERGRVLIKKPGKMRWDYTAPEEKKFVSDGVKLYSYIPEDKQVYVTSIPPADQATTPTLFLTGKGNLVRDFSPSFIDLPEGMPAGTRALKLIPKSPQRDYDWLILDVSPDTLLLRGLVAADAQGGTSSFVFTNLKENMGIADNEFTFKIPRGVDVITDAPSR